MSPLTVTIFSVLPVAVGQIFKVGHVFQHAALKHLKKCSLNHLCLELMAVFQKTLLTHNFLSFLEDLEVNVNGYMRANLVI